MLKTNNVLGCKRSIKKILRKRTKGMKRKLILEHENEHENETEN